MNCSYCTAKQALRSYNTINRKATLKNTQKAPFLFIPMYMEFYICGALFCVSNFSNLVFSVLSLLECTFKKLLVLLNKSNYL